MCYYKHFVKQRVINYFFSEQFLFINTVYLNNDKQQIILYCDLFDSILFVTLREIILITKRAESFFNFTGYFNSCYIDRFNSPPPNDILSAFLFYTTVLCIIIAIVTSFWDKETVYYQNLSHLLRVSSFIGIWFFKLKFCKLTVFKTGFGLPMV